MATLKFAPGFVLVDVKKGRAALAKQIVDSGSVTITATIVLDSAWGSDDGTSQEFNGNITEFAVIKIGEEVVK